MKDLAVIENILRNRHHFFIEIRDGIGLQEKIRAMLISCIAFLALYGAVMGSTHSLWQTLSSAVKLPLLFLATLIVCTPTLYFFNVLFGSNQSMTQNVAVIITAITVTAVILLSFAPITMFFLLTTSHYQFFKLLNVAIFAIAGIAGVVFLSQGMRMVSASGNEGAGARRSTLSSAARWPGRYDPLSALPACSSSCSANWEAISTPTSLPASAKSWASSR